MALNPYFLQGSPGEQSLVQDLINEQLKIYGIEVFYIPRRYITKNTVIREVVQSEFDSAYPIEAYVDSYEGYGGQGTLLSKFGIQNVDDLTLIISRERYENYITPLIKSIPNIELATRPKEGDLIYFPLGDRLFEIKYVEHEQPFYQLKKTYVYQLRCELFRYEDEVIDTNVKVIDEVVQTEGYAARLILSGIGSNATANTTVVFGGVQQIFVQNDGFGYAAAPTIGITTSVGTNADAVAIMTSGIGTAKSIDKILLINPGSGYIGIPTVTVPGTGIATAGVSTQGSIGIAVSYTHLTLPTTSMV